MPHEGFDILDKEILGLTIVNSEKKGTMNYNAKEEILKVNFFMDTGIRH